MIEMDIKKLVAIQHSAISGEGSFAEEDIQKGSFITTLTGTPFPKTHIIESDDPLQIDENTYVCLDHASKTINHSCDPNAGIRHKADLYAIKDIKQGEEITYDYATTIGIDDTISAMPCACGASHCRKVIRNALSIPQEQLEQYARLNALPQFIRDALKI